MFETGTLLFSDSTVTGQVTRRSISAAGISGRRLRLLDHIQTAEERMQKPVRGAKAEVVASWLAAAGF